MAASSPNFLALFNVSGNNLGNALTLLSGEPATGAQIGAFTSRRVNRAAEIAPKDSPALRVVRKTKNAQWSENVRVVSCFCVGAEGEELETNILRVLLRKYAYSCEPLRR